MTNEIDDLTINFEEEGVLVCKQLDKEILTRGAWTTIVYRYQNWEKAKQQYGPDRYSIRRYQKSQGKYMQRSKFNISSQDQAKKVIETLMKWIEEEA
ncbi:MAG: hypothetical protein V3V61_06445 [Gammaproteobacteria bacterium]